MKHYTEHLMPRYQGQMIRTKKISGFDSMTLKEDERILLETHALDIFTRCSNSGLPLRDALVAIMLTGINWGMNASQSGGES